MALSNTSMAQRIQTYVLGVTAQQVTGPGASIDGYQLAILDAFCQGIIDEIHAHAVVTVPNIQVGTSSGTGTVA